MYTQKFLKDAKRLEEEWDKECDRVYGEQEFKATTASGIPIKPVYGPLDIKDMKPEDLSLPGSYPYTRGNYPLAYQFRPWANEFGLGFGLPEDTRARYDDLTKEGMASYLGLPVYFAIFDIASQGGYDPDHPAARSRIGQCGSSMATLKDFEILFGGLPLDKLIVFLGTVQGAMPAVAMYTVLAERMGFPVDQLRGTVWNFPWCQWHWDTCSFRPHDALKVVVELIKHTSKNMPRWRPMALQAYDIEEAGGNAIQEVAFILATHIAVTEESIRAGVDPDKFVGRFGHEISLTPDFFETIAKFRAFRRLWARINKERFGCKEAKSLKPSLFLQTAGSSLTAQQPLNNVVRLTMETLAGVFSGADGIWTVGYDEALALPTKEAATLSLRMQQILYHETGIANVSDPLAGSYYVEWLTNKIEEEVMKLVKRVDEIGYVNAWQTGWFKGEITRNALQWRRAVDTGEKIVVGVNKYATAEEKVSAPVFEVNPEVERVAKERIKKWKQERDSYKTKVALGKMEEAAKKVQSEWPNGGDLMPAVMDAVRADATMGEMMGVLKTAFGWGYPM